VNPDPSPQGDEQAKGRECHPFGSCYSIRSPQERGGRNSDNSLPSYSKDRALTPHQLIRAVPEGFILASGLQ